MKLLDSFLTTAPKFPRTWKQLHKTVVMSSTFWSLIYRKHSDQVTKAPMTTSCKNERRKRSCILKSIIQTYPAPFFPTGMKSSLVFQSDIPKHSEGKSEEICLSKKGKRSLSTKHWDGTFIFSSWQNLLWVYTI